MVSDQESIQQKTKQKRKTKRKGNLQDSFPIPTRPRRGGDPLAWSGLFIKVRHWDPLKNGPGERFWKHMKNEWKNNRKINGIWWSKTIEKYWKTNTLLDFWSFPKAMKKRCQRGPQKSCFGVQNGDMGLPGSTNPLIFDVLVMPRSYHFRTPSRWTKKSKESGCGAPMDRKIAIDYSTTPSFRAGGVPRINWK